MTSNPIVEEIHRIREEMLKEFNGDLHALARDSQRREAEARAAGRVVLTRPPRGPRIGKADLNKDSSPL